MHCVGDALHPGCGSYSNIAISTIRRPDAGLSALVRNLIMAAKFVHEKASKFQAVIRAATCLGIKPRTGVIVLVLYLLTTLVEGLGLGLIVSVLQFIQAGSDVASLARDWRVWQILVDAYGLLGVPITLGALLVTIFVAIMVRETVTYVRNVYMAKANLNVVCRVRNAAVSRYLKARLNYHEQEPLGQLVNDLTIELDRAVSCLFSMLMFAGVLIILTVYTIILFALSVKMTFAALAIVAFAPLIIRNLMKRSREVGIEVADANQAVAGFLVERLRSLRLIRLSGMETVEADAMARLNKRQRNKLILAQVLQARLSIVLEPVIAGLGLAFFYLGVRTYDLTLAELGLFVAIIVRLMPVAKDAMRIRQKVVAVLGSLDAVVKRLAGIDEAEEHTGGGQAIENLKQGIRFEDVVYQYPGSEDNRALRYVTLTIPAGRITALVGPSGSGKSTLIDLLPRLRELQTGRILFDGMPIEELSVDRLRGIIAYAPQSPQVFNVEIREHIGYGNPQASMAEIVSAAKLAGAHEFIEALPGGYGTYLGEGGVRLSGGQRQRLDLARTLVGRPQILILDEPTSQLDADSETLFLDALERIRRETSMTVVIVGHRLSTVAIADQIVVLRDGTVEAVGLHADLLQQENWYAAAYRRQFRMDDRQSARAVTQ